MEIILNKDDVANLKRDIAKQLYKDFVHEFKLVYVNEKMNLANNNWVAVLGTVSVLVDNSINKLIGVDVPVDMDSNGINLIKS